MKGSLCDKCKKPCDDKNVVRITEDGKDVIVEAIIIECSSR